MPTESGYVVDMQGTRAVVKTVRSEACQGCSSKGYCDAMGGAEMHVDAVNEIGARVGDKVMIEMSTQTFVAMSALVYLVPILALVGGMAVGNALAGPRGWDKDLTALLCGFTLFALAMAAVRWIGNRRAAKDPGLTPRIVTVQKRISPQK